MLADVFFEKCCLNMIKNLLWSGPFSGSQGLSHHTLFSYDPFSATHTACAILSPIIAAYLAIIFVFIAISRAAVPRPLRVRSKIFGGPNCDFRGWGSCVLGCTFLQNNRDLWKLANSDEVSRLGSVSRPVFASLGHKPIALRLSILQRYGLGKLLSFNVFSVYCTCS